MMATNTPITELDFLQVKENLKTFLSSQDRFKDYDFEGSNMNVLLDVMAYNTFQNNFYTNMAFAEMFLDSAQLRESVVSHAKEINYTPRSRSSAKAVVNVSLNVANSPAFVTIPAKTQFKAVCGSQTYNFYNPEAMTVYPYNNKYIAYGLDIFEGTYITESFVVNGDPSQRYILSNNTADTSSIKVTVREGISSTNVTEMTLKTNIFGVGATDNVYYIQAYGGDRYEVSFGNNTYGTEPTLGNIVIVEYRITAGEEANGITSFAAASTINGYNSVVSLASISKGGAERESIDSIKFFAPKALQVQDRAITASDYEILLKSAFPEIKSVLAFGGENAVPPQYGKVIVSIQHQENRPMTAFDANRYRSYIAPKSAIGIEALIRSAEYMYVEVDTTVTYDATNYSKTESDLRQSVYDTIVSYSTNNLEAFKSSFQASKFVAAIDNTDAAIVSNETYVRAIIEIAPLVNSSTNFKFSFANELRPNTDTTVRAPAVVSSSFIYNGVQAYLQDDAIGGIDAITISTTGEIIYVAVGIGTVDYITGDVAITGLKVDSYSGKIKIYGTTHNGNIITPKTRILSIRPQDLKITMLK